MPPFRASAIPAFTSALMAAAVLTGCASSRLSAEAPPGQRLAGDWKLDAARSDDLGKAVAELRVQAAKARHSGEEQQESGGHTRRRRMGGGSGGQEEGPQEGQEGGQADQDESAPGPDVAAPGAGIGLTPRASPVEQLMSSVPRGDYLRIAVSSSTFTVTSGDSSAEYTPGLESDITAEQGDAQQISGWKGADYVIDTRPQWGAEIIQTYALTKDGRLALTVRLTGGKTRFTFTRVYDRTTRVAPLAPPTIN